MVITERMRKIGNYVATAAIAGVLVAGLRWNWTSASKSFARQPRVRICAVAARPLSPGRVLQQDDVTIRLRRPEISASTSYTAQQLEYFETAAPLVGRQLVEWRQQPLMPNQIIVAKDLAEPSSARPNPVQFALPFARKGAMPFNRGATIILIPQGQQQSARSWPELEVLECVDPAIGDSESITLRLHAASMRDAMQVISAGEKLVPLIVAPGKPCAPPAPTPAKKSAQKSKKK